MAGRRLLPVVQEVRPYDGYAEISATAQTPGVSGRIGLAWGGRSPELLLDFGKKVTGYLVIETGEHSQDEFAVQYGPVRDCLMLPLHAPMPAGGRYVSAQYIACRYMRVCLSSRTLQPRDVFAQLKAVYLLASQYPVSRVGSFSCDDEDLGIVYERGAYTLELCMQKYSESCWFRQLDRPADIDELARSWHGRYGDYVLFDGPRRDREAWLGDIRTENLLAMTAFGAYDVAKNSLCLFADLQRPDGTVPGSGSSRAYFVEYGLWGIIAVWECYVYSGDSAFLAQMHPFVKNLVEYMDSVRDARGFLAGDGNWMWTLPREGCNAGLQMILVRALQCAAAIERERYDTAEAGRLEAWSRQVAESVEKEFWDEERGVYTERFRVVTDSMPVPLDVNCYAIVFGLADARRAPRILRYIQDNMWCPVGSTTLDKKMAGVRLEEDLIAYPLVDQVRAASDPRAKLAEFMYPHNKTVWPFINAYEVQARFMAGDTQGALELIRLCWDRERFAETGTFWEIVDPANPVFDFRSCYTTPQDDCHNSAAHGWSGWVAHLLQSRVLGVRPEAPGFTRAVVAPQTGNLQRAEGTVPTPRGVITVRIGKDERTYTLTVQAPEGVQVRLEVGDDELQGRKLETAGI